MNIGNLKVGMEFKAYKYVCEFLGEPIKNGVPKINQLEEWRRYFNWTDQNGWRWKITEVYDKPKSSFENALYKTMVIPVRCNKEDYEYLMQCNKWSAEVWNACVSEDKLVREQSGKFMTMSELQTFVKGKSPLHAMGNQHVFLKYYTARDAMFYSKRANHANSDKVKYPYKEKKFFSTGWNKNCFSFDYENVSWQEQEQTRTIPFP